METISHNTQETSSPAEPTKKFVLSADLGIITVPADHVPERYLEKFGERNGGRLYSHDSQISDDNFPNPSRVLRPGDRLHVSVFKQVVHGTTTSEERMAFLDTQSAVYTGAQGACLVCDLIWGSLPKGKWFISLDKPDRLWKITDGFYLIPLLHRYEDGALEFVLSDFYEDWREESRMLCFTEVE